MTSPLEALLTHAGFMISTESASIRITGEDRVRWLNGMTTNSIAALAPGEGCYTFFLNAQGKIQGDATAFLLAESILLRTAASQVTKLMEMLDRYIIMDDVELRAEPAQPALLLAGPAAPELLRVAGFTLPDAGKAKIAERGDGLQAIAGYSPLVPRYELLAADEEQLTQLVAELRGQAGSPVEVSAEVLEQLRLLEGTPRFGVDVRDRELPQETGQTRALHFAKGCYLGQEIVERIHSRGNLHRTFAGFVLKGDLPAAGTALAAADAPEKPVGELTSTARLELAGETLQLGLGYIRREALDRRASLVYTSGGAEGRVSGEATPVELPYAAALSLAAR